MGKIKDFFAALPSLPILIKMRDFGINFIDLFFDEIPEIDQSIDTVKEKLEESKKIIDKALLEMETQREQFEQIKKEAEISRQLCSMNEDQIVAINKFFESTLSQQEKRAFPKTFLLNLFFCVLSAILGAIFGFCLRPYFG